MKKTTEKTGYDVGFTYAVILCSMLLVFPFQVAGMEALPVILFFLCIVWMSTDVWQINRGRRQRRSDYRRLDFAVIALLAYEAGLIVVSMTREIGENGPEPDYSWNLLVISLALLYLLVMEAGKFRTAYLDMVLYGGLAVMAVLLLGYLFDPQIGACLRLWDDRTATASYLITLGIVGALQYCRCEARMRRIFYAICAELDFFLLACNHSVISFWIVVYALLSIPVLIRPTADLCKRAMQMVLFFLVTVSSMGLFANETNLFLTEVSYDAEHSVCLDMVAAAGAMVFFYCWYRKPEGMSEKKIVMRGFYKLDKLVLWGILTVCVLFASGAAAWERLDSERFGFRGVCGFAVPLIEEAGENSSLIYLCVREQGVTGAVLCVAVLVFLMERFSRTFGWDRPVKGMLCVAAVSLLPQILLWEMVPNILPVAVILTGGAIGAGKEKKVSKSKNRKGQGKKMNRNGKKEAHGKRAAFTVTTVMAVMVLCLMTSLSVQADDKAVQAGMTDNIGIVECSRIEKAVGDVDARKTPDESAVVVLSYHDGDNIFVTGETADGWYRVRYQDLTGYVRTDQTTEVALDVEALNDEFATEEDEGKLVVEEVERQRTELRRSRIWGAVIILLVLAVFATGVISAVKGKEKGDAEE